MIAASTECVVVVRSRAKTPAFAPLGVWLALLIAVFWFAAPASAQLDSGSISGTILDPTGKVVPSASVTIRGVDTGTIFSAVSSSTGSYVFPLVRPGRYDLSVTAPGFKATVNRGVVVAVGTSTAVDVSLTVGSTNETVSVMASDQTLELDTLDHRRFHPTRAGRQASAHGEWLALAGDAGKPGAGRGGRWRCRLSRHH